MSFIRALFGSFSSILSITTPPLYRYPYRNSAQGLRGDMLKIGGDVDEVMEKE